MLALTLREINEHGTPVVPWQRTVQDIPWFWTRLCLYQKLIDSVRQMAQFDKEKMTPPLSYDWLDHPTAIEQWFKDRERH